MKTPRLHLIRGVSVPPPAPNDGRLRERGVYVSSWTMADTGCHAVIALNAQEQVVFFRFAFPGDDERDAVDEAHRLLDLRDPLGRLTALPRRPEVPS